MSSQKGLCRDGHEGSPSTSSRARPACAIVAEGSSVNSPPRDGRTAGEVQQSPDGFRDSRAAHEADCAAAVVTPGTWHTAQDSSDGRPTAAAGSAPRSRRRSRGRRVMPDYWCVSGASVCPV